MLLARVRAQRARAPFFAMEDRFAADSFVARALPPLRPPKRPSATAAGFFPSDCSMSSWTPLNAASFGWTNNRGQVSLREDLSNWRDSRGSQ